MTWGGPSLPSGLDQFTAEQLPNPRPVDDLSRFVMDRIRFAESEPRADMVPKFYTRPGGAMTHRYAGNVRRDMVAFRRIVAAYVTMIEAAADAAEKREDTAPVLAGMVAGSLAAVRCIANRFADHPDFREEWRV